MANNTLTKHIVLGIHITNRVQRVPDVQKALTDAGCIIRTRIGLHEAQSEVCSPNGLILVELLDNDAEVAKLEAALKQITGVEVKKMVFEHP